MPDYIVEVSKGSGACEGVITSQHFDLVRSTWRWDLVLIKIIAVENDDALGCWVSGLVSGSQFSCGPSPLPFIRGNPCCSPMTRLWLKLLSEQYGAALIV